ncbi:Uncharacterised protein [Legionella lansingensis]|uniref:Uncharacterized protein n=2 Tax=Legionella lansingensis TaxID=45067 RepID=A0A0W0VQW6_9GAMM|nr:hypothetical protein [Legionella lansingensis]KTD22153.1 hypothetical protein Llan_1416 [Legionella lansingensis]SNV54541.1 Uncharacterised protein [Legionella lansingensis]
MSKFSFSVFAIGSLIATSASATHIIEIITGQTGRINKQNTVHSIAKSDSDDYVNFTGDWQGSCKYDDGEPQTGALKIINDRSHIEFNGVSFKIGHLTTMSSAGYKSTWYDHMHFYWNTTKDKLLGQGNAMWTRYGQSKLNSNFGSQLFNVVLSLNQDQLQMRTVYFELNDSNEAEPNQNGYTHISICTFTKIK